MIAVLALVLDHGTLLGLRATIPFGEPVSSFDLEEVHEGHPGGPLGHVREQITAVLRLLGGPRRSQVLEDGIDGGEVDVVDLPTQVVVAGHRLVGHERAVQICHQASDPCQLGQSGAQSFQQPEPPRCAGEHHFHFLPIPVVDAGRQHARVQRGNHDTTIVLC